MWAPRLKLTPTCSSASLWLLSLFTDALFLRPSRIDNTLSSSKKHPRYISSHAISPRGSDIVGSPPAALHLQLPKTGRIWLRICRRERHGVFFRALGVEEMVDSLSHNRPSALKAGISL